MKVLLLYLNPSKQVADPVEAGIKSQNKNTNFLVSGFIATKYEKITTKRRHTVFQKGMLKTAVPRHNERNC